jgi:hypothetical protein
VLYNLFPLFFPPLFSLLPRRELRQQVRGVYVRPYVTRTTLTEPARTVVPRGSFSSFSLHGRARYTRALTHLLRVWNAVCQLRSFSKC